MSRLPRPLAWLWCALLVLGLGAPAGATTPTQTVTSEGPQDITTSENPWLRLDAAPPTVTPTTPTVLQVSVHAGADEIPAGWSILLTMQAGRLGSRSAVRNWTSDSLEGPVGQQLSAQPLTEPIPAHGTRQIEFSLPPGSLNLPDDPAAWGPHGAAFVLVDDGIQARKAITRTFLIWDAGIAVERKPAVTVLLPVTAGRLDPSTGLPPARLLADASAGRLARLLDLLQRPGVVSAIDPAVLSATVPPAADQNAPPVPDPALTQWVERLRAATTGREAVGLPYGNTDYLALATAGDLDSLALDAERLGTEAFDSAGITVRRDLALPPAALADVKTAELYAANGRDAGIVLADDVQAPSRTARVTPTGRSQIKLDEGTMPSLLADSDLSQALALTDDPGPDGGAGAVQRLLADTSALAREAPNRERHVLVLAPSTLSGSASAANGLSALTQSTWTQPGTLTDLLAQDPPIARDQPELSSVERRSALSSSGVKDVATTLSDIQALLGVLAEPADKRTVTTRAAAGLVSAAWRTDGTAWSKARQAFAGEVVALRSGIRVVQGSRVTQVSRNVRLPVTVENTTVEPVQVRLDVTPRSSRLVVTGQVTVLVPARSRAIGYVPVRGVGNGDTSVVIRLRAPSGVELGQPVETQVQVRADWETFGTGTIAIIAGIGLVIGIIRSLRRGTRTSRRPRDPLEPADQAPTSGVS